MHGIALLFAPLLLLGSADSAVETVDQSPVEATGTGSDDYYARLQSAAGQTPKRQQVRIRQRVILRVTPYRRLNATVRPRNVVERKIGKCIDLKEIAGVQPDVGRRLIFYMRDRSIVAGSLEKSCAARSFYSGFYVEPDEDGRLCIDRDRLQSRTGAKCKLERFRELVAE
ncbi:hypothetical protein [Qipengyuania sp. JC766]|uniref:hypothetical protein n=1 Tax=Qipengyuania sp. JC766 TaxID=3232139 RepID=UPI00345A1A72